MGGRNLDKLERIRDKVADNTITLVVANSNDSVSLDKMAKRTKVICTTVGPYGKYGSKLVAACVQNQTHYCDLAGEVLWMRDMIDQHHEAAKANGTKIVHTCGFDSIPSDMGVYFVQKQAMATTGKPAKHIKMRVKATAGGISGGTYASLSDTIEKAQKDKSLYKVLFDPYGLNPQEEREGPDKPDLSKVVYDHAANSWIFPFIMAAINTKVVRRSNALADYPYGKDFRYDEAVMSGKGLTGRLKGYANAAVLGVLTLAKPGTITKKLVDKVLPEPGEGPSKEKRESGFFNIRFISTLKDGSSLTAKVTGDRDPGYGSTCKMLAESAICLAKDDTPDAAGVLTPSVAMGEALLIRLQSNAGLTFSIDQ
jgi:short subunit dehydrogenase-like uncharacterized protein